MRKVAVVSAFVPLKVKHLSAEQYHEYGDRLAAACDGRFMAFHNELHECWLAQEYPPMVPATETPADRYDTPEAHVQSHIVQHNRTTWALQAAGDADVVVWLDYAILKQGAWRNNPVTEDHVREFLAKVEAYTGDDIPFPGIEERKPINVHGDNWRFCGSTHIWPVKYLPQIDRHYKFQCRKFIWHHKCVPLDLAIWPAVEAQSGLPFRWYKAEYDASQLTEFPS